MTKPFTVDRKLLLIVAIALLQRIQYAALAQTTTIRGDSRQTQLLGALVGSGQEETNPTENEDAVNLFKLAISEASAEKLVQRLSLPIVTPFRINCGEKATYQDKATSSEWEPDQFFIGGNVQRGCDQSQSRDFVPDLYCTARHGQQVKYSIKVPTGTSDQQYKITLHFIEQYWQQLNRRVANVYIQGHLVKENLDYYKEFGFQTPGKLSFYTTVSRGIPILSIIIISSTENVTADHAPTLTGIEIENNSNEGAVTMRPSSANTKSPMNTNKPVTSSPTVQPMNTNKPATSSPTVQPINTNKPVTSSPTVQRLRSTKTPSAAPATNSNNNGVPFVDTDSPTTSPFESVGSAPTSNVNSNNSNAAPISSPSNTAPIESPLVDTDSPATSPIASVTADPTSSMNNNNNNNNTAVPTAYPSTSVTNGVPLIDSNASAAKDPSETVTGSPVSSVGNNNNEDRTSSPSSSPRRPENTEITTSSPTISTNQSSLQSGRYEEPDTNQTTTKRPKKIRQTAVPRTITPTDTAGNSNETVIDNLSSSGSNNATTAEPGEQTAVPRTLTPTDAAGNNNETMIDNPSINGSNNATTVEPGEQTDSPSTFATMDNGFIVNIDSGYLGKDFLDNETGLTWLTDQYFVDNATYSAKTETCDEGMHEVYCSFRTGAEIIYNIAVPRNGSYKIILYVIEPKFEGPGKRLIDIDVEDVALVKDYDIFNEAGGKMKPGTIELFTNVIDSMLTIKLSSPLGKGVMINGLSVQEGSGSNTGLRGPPKLPLRINSGFISNDIKDSLTGVTWSKDAYMVRDGTSIKVESCANNSTGLDQMYCSYRIGYQLTYNIPVDKRGIFFVTLYTMEPFFSRKNKRVVDIYLEDKIVIEKYDPFLATGGKNKPGKLTVNTTVTDGMLNIKVQNRVLSQRNLLYGLMVEYEAEQR